MEKRRADMIQTAIVGLGRWGQALVESVQDQSKSIRFAAAVTRTPSKVSQFAEKYGLPLSHDYRAVLKDTSIDAVALATPHSQHTEQVIAAAEAGKHVFVEKPFTLTRSDAERAVAAVRRAGVVLAVGHNRRFLPAVAELIRRLEDEDLGRLFHVEANFSSPAALGYEPGMWRTNPIEVPSGGMTGMGIHMIDQMICLFGPIVMVHAQSLRRLLTFDIDDTTSMLFKFENGMTGYLGTMTATTMNWRLQVFGSRGWVEIRDESRIEIRPLEGEIEVIEYQPFNSVLAEFDAFAAAVAGSADFPVSTDQAIEGVAALEAVNRSASSGQTVHIA
jgi:predicted dehydrogenase